MEGLDVPMYTEPQFDDLDEDDEKENQGMKLFLP